MSTHTQTHPRSSMADGSTSDPFATVTTDPWADLRRGLLIIFAGAIIAVGAMAVSGGAAFPRI